MAKAIRSNLLSPGGPAPPKLFSTSLSTHGLTSFVLFIRSPLRGLSGAHAPSEDLQQAVYTCLAGGWARGSGRGRGSRGLPRLPGPPRLSTSGCQMTVVRAAAGTAARAKGTARVLMCSAFPRGTGLASTGQLQLEGVWVCWLRPRPRGLPCRATARTQVVPPQADASCERRGSRGQPVSAQLILSHQGCPGPSKPSSPKISESSPVSDSSGTRQASADLSEAKRIGGQRPREGPASPAPAAATEYLSPEGLHSTRSFLTAPEAASPRSRGPQGAFSFQTLP